MSYSYGGWEDEFTGLTKENEFSGRPAPRPTPRPDGLGSKPTPRPRIIKDDEEDPTPTPRPDPVKEVIQEVVDNYAALSGSGGASLKEAFTGEGGLSVATAKPSDLTTASKTALYLAQHDARQNDVLAYLTKYINIDIKKDVLGLQNVDMPEELAIYENITKGSLVSKDESLSFTAPNGNKQTIYDWGFARANQVDWISEAADSLAEAERRVDPLSTSYAEFPVVTVDSKANVEATDGYIEYLKRLGEYSNKLGVTIKNREIGIKSKVPFGGESHIKINPRSGDSSVNFNWNW